MYVFTDLEVKIKNSCKAVLMIVQMNLHMYIYVYKFICSINQPSKIQDVEMRFLRRKKTCNQGKARQNVVVSIFQQNTLFATVQFSLRKICRAFRQTDDNAVLICDHIS
jgi:hypothetical protein